MEMTSMVAGERKPLPTKMLAFGQNSNYLFELAAEPGGPEGRSLTTAGSGPISILDRPPGVRPSSPGLVDFGLTPCRKPGSAMSRSHSAPFVQFPGNLAYGEISDTAYSRSMCYDAFGNGWVTAYSGSTPVPGNAPEILNGACPSASTSTPYSATTNQQNGVNYDAAGNETSYGGNTLTYDAENRLSAITSPSGSVLASYQYDGDGRRISKTVSGVTTNYVYDVEGRLMAEYEGGSLSKEYIRMHSQFISSQTELVAIENAPGNGSPCTTCFVISDDLGNVRLTANNDGRWSPDPLQKPQRLSFSVAGSRRAAP